MQYLENPDQSWRWGGVAPLVLFSPGMVSLENQETRVCLSRDARTESWLHAPSPLQVPAGKCRCPWPVLTTFVLAWAALCSRVETVVAADLDTLGSWEVPGEVLAMDAQAGRVYTVGLFGESRTRGLRIYHVGDPTCPALVGQWESGTSGMLEMSVCVAGGYAYVTWVDMQENRGGLEILDVRDPANPGLSGALAVAGWPRAIRVVGDYAYVANHHTGLEVFSVADRTHPVRLAGAPAGGGAFNFAITDSNVYAVWSVWDQQTKKMTGRLQVYNLANPALPVPGLSYETKYAAYGVAWANCCVYVVTTDSQGKGEFLVYSAADPDALQKTQSRNNIAEAYSVLATGTYLYTVGASGVGGGNVRWLRLDGELLPVYLGAAETPTVVAHAGAEDRLYLAASDGTVQIRTGTPRKPVVNSVGVAPGNQLAITWPVVDGYRLQFTPTLDPADWVDVAGSESTNRIEVPMTGQHGFFRVVGP